jgi:hypothetical protein
MVQLWIHEEDLLREFRGEIFTDMPIPFAVLASFEHRLGTKHSRKATRDLDSKIENLLRESAV